MTDKTTVSLKNYHTFHLDVSADSIIQINSVDELKSYFKNKKEERKWIVLGGGSNVVFRNHFDGDVLVMKSAGIEILQDSISNKLLRVNAGTIWHEFVSYCVENNLGGVENLALIPGTVGASPIQNIGAYGVEVKDVIMQVNALNLIDLTEVCYSNSECKFDYRDSIFKNELKNRVLITSVDFNLTKKEFYKINLSYKPVSEYLSKSLVEEPEIKDVFNAVISIRSSKLPNPDEVGNSGSFFKNPIISKSQFEDLINSYPEIPHFNLSNSEIKIPAGWLIEKAGWKGYRKNDVGVYPKQALVLVNYGNANPNEVLTLVNEIKESVNQLFSIQLQIEVNII